MKTADSIDKIKNIVKDMWINGNEIYPERSFNGIFNSLKKFIEVSIRHLKDNQSLELKFLIQSGENRIEFEIELDNGICRGDCFQNIGVVFIPCYVDEKRSRAVLKVYKKVYEKTPQGNELKLVLRKIADIGIKPAEVSFIVGLLENRRGTNALYVCEYIEKLISEAIGHLNRNLMVSLGDLLERYKEVKKTLDESGDSNRGKRKKLEVTIKLESLKIKTRSRQGVIE